MSDQLASVARDQQLLLAFVELADTLVDDYDVVDVLYRLAGYCVTPLGAAAAGLLLSDQHGGLQVIAASNERTRLLELLQLQADEGPCLEAYRSGESVHVDDLAGAVERWPTFAPAALAEGFHSVQAMPLRLRRQVIGALNMFGHTAGPLGSHNLAVARALADTATIGILQERAIRRHEVLTEQLQSALNSRVVIEQAKGVISHAGRIPMDQAFEQLRSYCRDRNLRLSRVAEDVAQSRLTPDTVLADPDTRSPAKP
ncbi:GAF and ANTAR domain-containing protein [Amycolatopsis anabasis]|uniref:GAF and ANTAR domain-containing protein n=1 Tax=Amycolatopsis anabasis TaxID=1840409 RepID=UPI00131C3147|nr:GAF and ANTAR domain-containing protein [Amycolatopsis anabasis]